MKAEIEFLIEKTADVKRLHEDWFLSCYMVDSVRLQRLLLYGTKAQQRVLPNIIKKETGTIESNKNETGVARECPR